MTVKDDWPEPNYDNPVIRTPIPALIAVVVLLTGISFTIVSLRVYCRWVLLRSFGSDDWLMLIALVCAMECHKSDLGGSRELFC